MEGDKKQMATSIVDMVLGNIKFIKTEIIREIVRKSINDNEIYERVISYFNKLFVAMNWRYTWTIGGD